MNDFLDKLASVLEGRQHADAKQSYVARLCQAGPDAVLKKIGEEATEVILAAKSGEATALVHEVADLWFHLMVLLAQHGLHPHDVVAELEGREGVSGITEKSRRKL